MKKHLFLSAAALSLFLGLFSSCGNDVSSASDAKGRISPLVEVEPDFIEAELLSRAVPQPNINKSHLFMKLTSADGSLARQWASVNDFSADEEFPIGDYTIEVGYADPKAEGLKCTPAYYASQDIKIYENQTTPVSLTAARTHAYVSVNFSDAVKGYFSRVEVDVKSASGKTTTFLHSTAYSETATACIVPGDAVITLDLEKKSGVKSGNIQIVNFNAEARNHYIVNLEVNEGEVGSETLTVTFDDKTGQETVKINLSDEMLTTPGPELSLEGVADGGTIEFVEGCYAGEPVRVVVNARGDIASVNLDTHSTFLREFKPWPLSVDLVNASSDDRDNMIDVGLECKGIWGDPNREPSRMGFIDFTKLINNIEYFDADHIHNNECSFTLTAKDHNGKSTEAPVAFFLKVNKLHFALSNPSVVKFFETTMTVDLTFNGGDAVKDDIVFSAKDEDSGTGEYKTLKVDEIETLGENSYRVHLSGLPVYGGEVNLNAQFGNYPAPLRVERVAPEFSISTAAGDVDVFATKAYVSVGSSEAAPALLAPMASFWMGDTRLSAERVDNSTMFLITGLEPGKANVITASLTNNPQSVCSPLTLNTEVAAQLPNNDMEDWETDKFVAGSVATCSGIFGIGGGNNHWDHFYPYKKNDSNTQGWETVNEITLSDARKDRCNFGYCTASGTISTTDGHSGIAALVRTVGWGQGATSAGNSSIFKNITAGQLYLGSFNLSTMAPDYGYAFASRPAELEFYYKYAPKNSADYASVEIRVMADNGEIITKKADFANEVNIRKITKTDSYTRFSVPFEYELRKKAKSITVIFISSANTDCLHANKDNLNPPGDAKLDGTQAVGSELYIDDVKLIY